MQDDEREPAEGHLGKPTKPGEPTVRLSGEHLVVAFCSVLDTLTENSKELAQKDESILELERQVKEQVHWRAEGAEKHKAELEEVRHGLAPKDSDRMDYYACNCHRFVHNRQTDEWSIMGDVQTYTTLREAIDVAASAEQEEVAPT